jgi:hypothetical protein
LKPFISFLVAPGFASGYARQALLVAGCCSLSIQHSIWLRKCYAKTRVGRSMFDVHFFIAFSFFACGYAGHALPFPCHA